LETKIYEEPVRTALQTLSITVLKTNQLLTYTVKAAVCSEMHTKHTTQSEHDVEILNFKPGGT